MTYILLIVSLINQGGQSMAVEFNSKAACESAKEVIDTRVKGNYFTKDAFIIECVSKH